MRTSIEVEFIQTTGKSQHNNDIMQQQVSLVSDCEETLVKALYAFHIFV